MYLQEKISIPLLVDHSQLMSFFVQKLFLQDLLHTITIHQYEDIL